MGADGSKGVSRVSAEHKRPLFAFVMVTILCAVMLGHAIRSDALGELLPGWSTQVTAQAPRPVTLDGDDEVDTTRVAARSALSALSGRQPVALASTSEGDPAVPTAGQSSDAVLVATGTTVVVNAAQPGEVLQDADDSSASLPTGTDTSAAEKAAEKAARAADRAAAKAARAEQRAAAKAARAAQAEQRAADRAAQAARRAADRADRAARRAATKAERAATRQAEKALADAVRAARKAAQATEWAAQHEARAAEKAVRDAAKAATRSARDTGTSAPHDAVVTGTPVVPSATGPGSSGKH